jgi:hypothetical protein
MRQGTCCQCGLTTSIQSFYSLNGMTYCEPCVWKASREAKENGLSSEYVSLTDNSICARCGVHNDVSEFPLFDKHPVCPACASLVSDWPYPQWLKLSMLGVAVLLLVALLTGRKYFHAGRAMYIGERLVEKGRYGEALPFLRQTLQVAPGSDKAVLLAAKAALLTGDVETAQKVLQNHGGGHFDDSSDSGVQEVERLWKRAVAALEKADQANKLEEQGNKRQEAAHMMQEATSMYPESYALAFIAQTYEADAALDRKDYDRFLTLAETQWKTGPSLETAVELSYAAACKYAVTGDAPYREESQAILAKAQSLAHGDPRKEARMQKFAERIQYFLDTRTFSTKAEYDQKFGTGQKSTQ